MTFSCWSNEMVSLIGDLMVKIEDAWAPAEAVSQARGVQAELGWALRPEDTGHGYATEAVEAALRVCFEDLGLRRVPPAASPPTPRRTGSWKGVGMRREARTVKNALHPSGSGWTATAMRCWPTSGVAVDVSRWDLSVPFP